MDIDAFFLHQQLEQMEVDEVEDERQMAGAAIAIIVLGTVEAHRLRSERRKPSRLYLCRPQLLPNPRYATAWQVLYRSRSDRAYITTMGLVSIGTAEPRPTAGIILNSWEASIRRRLRSRRSTSLRGRWRTVERRQGWI
ncbi:hypothetical protein B0H12DRAFT_1112779 [Mycena haematopus]|nr:hypothetical protein B0H12DRAFT_1112779 [Mycena haematopus]